MTYYPELLVFVGGILGACLIRHNFMLARLDTCYREHNPNGEGASWLQKLLPTVRWPEDPDEVKALKQKHFKEACIWGAAVGASWISWGIVFLFQP